jgi:hypothetical protein
MRAFAEKFFRLKRVAIYLHSLFSSAALTAFLAGGRLRPFFTKSFSEPQRGQESILFIPAAVYFCRTATNSWGDGQW